MFTVDNNDDKFEENIMELINDKDSFIYQDDSVLAAGQEMIKNIKGDDTSDVDKLYPLRIEPNVKNSLYIAELLPTEDNLYMEVSLLQKNFDEDGWTCHVIAQAPILMGDNHIRLAKYFAKVISVAKENLDAFDFENV